jgi:penicillin-binding protein 1A
MKTGIQAVKTIAAAAGISSPIRDYANAFLGSSEVTLDEIVLGYTVFPNLGQRPADLYIIQSVQDSNAKTIFNAPRKRYQVMSPAAAYQVHSCLSDYMERGLGSLANKQFGLGGFPVAGKAGTAYGFTDTYFIGYSQAITCGVWVGFDKPTKIYRGAFGKDLALPIWSKIMNVAEKDFASKVIEKPTVLKPIEICRSSGLLVAPRCTQAPSAPEGALAPQQNVTDVQTSTTYKEWATELQAPTIICDIHGGGVRNYAKEFDQDDWPKAAAAVDLTKIRPIAMTASALVGFNDVYQSVRPGAESDNDANIPVAKAIPVDTPPPSADAPAAPPAEIEVRRAEPVNAQSQPLEAPALSLPPPAAIDLSN